LAHALTAGIVWYETVTVARPAGPSVMSISADILLSCIIGSALDIDHFITAGSLSLHDATNLSYRPLGHSVLFLVLSTGIMHAFSRSRSLTILYFSALLIHQLRDSLRRGIYLWPIGSTHPTSLLFYMIICVSLPHGNAAAMSLGVFREKGSVDNGSTVHLI